MSKKTNTTNLEAAIQQYTRKEGNGPVLSITKTQELPRGKVEPRLVRGDRRCRLHLDKGFKTTLKEFEDVTLPTALEVFDTYLKEGDESRLEFHSEVTTLLNRIKGRSLILRQKAFLKDAIKFNFNAEPVLPTELVQGFYGRESNNPGNHITPLLSKTNMGKIGVERVT